MITAQVQRPHQNRMSHVAVGDLPPQVDALLNKCLVRRADAQEEVKKLRAEVASAKLDNAETDALVERARKLEVANKLLQAQLDAEVRCL